MKRYNLNVHHGDSWMDEDPEGDYVRYIDFKEIDKWKSMEIAPKDGSLILLYWHNTSKRPWRAERGYSLAFWSDPSIGDTLPENAGWYACESDSNRLNELHEPSLWAPIPKLPKSIFIGTLTEEIVHPDGSRQLISRRKIPIVDKGIDMMSTSQPIKGFTKD